MAGQSSAAYKPIGESGGDSVAVLPDAVGLVSTDNLSNLPHHPRQEPRRGTHFAPDAAEFDDDGVSTVLAKIV